MAAIVCSFFGMRAADALAIIGCRKSGVATSSFTAWELDADFGIESRRAWMERHDPVGSALSASVAVNGIISRADEDGSDGRRRRVNRGQVLVGAGTLVYCDVVDALGRKLGGDALAILFGSASGTKAMYS